MNCEQARDCLLEHLYQELDADASRSVQAHLDDCPECRRECEQLEKTHALLTRAEQNSAASRGSPNSPQLWQQAWVAAQASRRRWRRAAWVIAVAASLLLVIWLSNLQVAVHSTHVTIGWSQAGDQRPGVGEESSAAKKSAADDQLSSLEQSLAQHEQRLRELDRLVRLLERVTEVEHQARMRDLVSLEVLLQSVADRNDTRWNTVAHLFRNQNAGRGTIPPPGVIPEGVRP
jgi:hypothetical protein